MTKYHCIVHATNCRELNFVANLSAVVGSDFIDARSTFPTWPARSGVFLGSEFLSSDGVKIETTNDALPIRSKRKIELKDSGRRRPERAAIRLRLSQFFANWGRCGTCKCKFQNRMLEMSIPVPQQNKDRRSIPIEGQSTTQEPCQKEAA